MHHELHEEMEFSASSVGPINDSMGLGTRDGVAIDCMKESGSEN